MIASRHAMNDLRLHPTVIVCDRILPATLTPAETVRQLSLLAAQGDAAMAQAIQASAAAREAEGSTYIGRGLAVPHARLAGLPIPVVVLAAAEGITWGEGIARLIALPVVPAEKPEEHLRLLAALARYISAHRNDTPIKLREVASALNPPGH